MTKATFFQKTLRRHKKKVLLSTANLKYREFMQRIGCYIASLTQGKTGVSLNSLQEWLVGCFWCLRNQLSSEHSIISRDV